MEDTNYGQINIIYDSYEKQKSAYEKMSFKDSLRLIIISGIIGFCMIAFKYLGDVLASWITNSVLIDYYFDSIVIYNATQIFFSMFAIVLPFTIGNFLIKRITPSYRISYHLPKTKSLLFAALAISFLTLIISNFVTSFFILAAESVGFEFEIYPFEAAKNVPDFLWQFLATAITPALVEEFAMRGVVLQSLRKYGDSFAIIVSAVIFALMHGNMVQTPFALILGIVIGWFVVITDSLWTGIAIHLMNNTYALVVTTMGEYLSDGWYLVIAAVINVVGSLLGLAAIIWLIATRRHDIKLYEPGGNTSKVQAKYRVSAFICTIISIPMFAALIIMIKEVIGTVSFVGIN